MKKRLEKGSNEVKKKPTLWSLIHLKHLDTSGMIYDGASCATLSVCFSHKKLPSKASKSLSHYSPRDVKGIYSCRVTPIRPKIRRRINEICMRFLLWLLPVAHSTKLDKMQNNVQDPERRDY